MRRLVSALCPTAALPMAPPSTQSPFARSWRYLDQGDVNRLLRGHYSPVMALTDSFVNPARLSSPSAEASFEESLQVATSPCCQRNLPDGWDRTRARPALGGGLPFQLFR